jgi:hypothetical protein
MANERQRKMETRDIRRSGLFDRSFYRRTYGIPASQSPERHYVEFGEALGHRPSRVFSPREYLKVNPDVAESGHSPFWHYVTYGQREGRALQARPDAFKALDFSDVPTAAQFEGFTPSHTWAVVVHIYYHEMWPLLEKRLSDVDGLCDLFITVAMRANRPEGRVLRQRIEATFPAARVFSVPNHGRDLFALVALANAGVLEHYDAIGKIHTKCSPHLALGQAWRDCLLDAVLPSRAGIRELVTRFTDTAEVGIVTANGQVKEGDHWWFANRHRAAALLRNSDLRPGDHPLRFAAGSMYWLKPAVLASIRELNLVADDFDLEAGQSDGTTAHALERIIGLLTQDQGLSIATQAELLGDSPPPVPDFIETDNDETPARTAADLSAQNKDTLHAHDFEGTIDELTARGVVGWVRDRNAPNRRWWIQLWVDGQLVSRVFANQHREDLVSRGLHDGHYGYALPIPAAFFDEASHAFKVEVQGDAWNWESMAIMACLPTVRHVGAVTQIEGGSVSGWCCIPSRQDLQPIVELLVDGGLVASSRADLKRSPFPEADADVGHDFEIQIPDHLCDGRERDIEIRVSGSLLPLLQRRTCIDENELKQKDT